MKNPCLICDYHHYLVKQANKWQELGGYKKVGMGKNAERCRQCKPRHEYLDSITGNWGPYYNPGAQCSTADDVEVNLEGNN